MVVREMVAYCMSARDIVTSVYSAASRSGQATAACACHRPSTGRQSKEMLGYRIKRLLEKRIVFAVLFTLPVWFIFAGLPGNVLPIVSGLLISAFIHWRFSQHLTTLALTRQVYPRDKG